MHLLVGTNECDLLDAVPNSVRQTLDINLEMLRTLCILSGPHSLKELQSLGIPFSNQDDVNNIKTLKNHESYFSSLNYEGVFMKDIPFFQIMSEQNDLADSSE